MPIDYSKYPPNWLTETRPRILERDGHKCKKCGVPNHSVRDKLGQWYESEDVADDLYHTHGGRQFGGEEYEYPTLTKIVLTIAHVHCSVPYQDADWNLAALCQRCHLALDRPHHNRKAAITRRKKKEAATGQLALDLPASKDPREWKYTY